MEPIFDSSNKFLKSDPKEWQGETFGIESSIISYSKKGSINSTPLSSENCSGTRNDIFLEFYKVPCFYLD